MPPSGSMLCHWPMVGGKSGDWVSPPHRSSHISGCGQEANIKH